MKVKYIWVRENSYTATTILEESEYKVFSCVWGQ
jgi:hypothetical protein